MNENELPLTDERWQAIVSNDTAYNNRFIYAIKTTGIFCKPSCKSRIPNRENVRIYANAEQAHDAGFRPCKRCKPTGERLPDQEWVAVAAQYINKHYNEPLPLQTIADACHGSPYHLQRTFKRIMGVSPSGYVQQMRISKAQQLLNETNHSVAGIAAAVGMPNVAYFITLFKNTTGCTPIEYRLRSSRNEIG
ncbi:bifunctional transcriptional activator/DNA repair enzyme AdaA [Paenibacillus radicis (ex Gao et al. 2016)]|uniref:Bifunctional transcriptional activator/DNA repair enzyme AdaA n=1 Tax=Paenibacillus radicis (ex Gao et al. 2016) TaxID=1737354 RepID=A0A917HIH5_9BACL|nr:bifunctional transcriptional activator/DNA repair enzyme AdaA [Paenibacillus radicis (ex Gao et al. 2016)]GGG79177.1 bifunctional transcriptional activator/DNA repair enzyme AdaA [Paenibacillus radicis (ex Gao et al. 2016)]